MQGGMRSFKIQILLSQYAVVHAMHVFLVTLGLLKGDFKRHTSESGSYVHHPLFLALAQHLPATAMTPPIIYIFHTCTYSSYSGTPQPLATAEVAPQSAGNNGHRSQVPSSGSVT